MDATETAAIRRLETMPFEPLLTREEVLKGVENYDKMRGTLFAMSSLMTMDRPAMVEFLRSLRTEDGDDAVMSLCDGIRGLSDWLGALNEFAGSAEARLMITCHEVFGMSWAETAPDPSPEQAAWTQLTDNLAAARDALNADDGKDEARYEQLGTAYMAAQDAFLRTPAPTIGAALDKLELENEIGGNREHIEPIIVELRRLAGEGC